LIEQDQSRWCASHIQLQTSGNFIDRRRISMTGETLPSELLPKMDAYWRAANYLSVGQIYLYDNPLLKEPLALAHVKPMLLGHWGTTPGQNFIYVHLNRVIKKYDLNLIYVSGPGHGGPAVVSNTYLEPPRASRTECNAALAELG
jgi:phosphoketolase